MANKLIDKAQDNLWMVVDDVKASIMTLPPKSKLLKKGSVFSEGSKVNGQIFYFVPRDAKGKALTPVRLLRDNKGNFIDGDAVEPYYQNIIKNKSKWEDLGADDLIAMAESKLGIGGYSSPSYGADAVKIDGRAIQFSPKGSAYYNNMNGINKNDMNGTTDLLNAKKLEENVSGIYNENGRNILKTTDPYSIQYGIDATKAKGPNGYYPEVGYERQPMIDLGADGSKNGSDYANKIIDMRLGAMPHGNPHKEFDIQFGVTGSGTKQVYTAAEVAAMHKQSQTSRPLLDWLKSDGAKSLFDSVGKVAEVVKSNKQNTAAVPTTNANPNTGANIEEYYIPDEPKETKIWGMSPITFGLVAFGTLALLTVGSIVLIKHMKAKGLETSGGSTVK